MPISVAITASHDCLHAEEVITAVLAQLGHGDELIVLEPNPCDHELPLANCHQRHVVTATPDDFEMRVIGVAESKGDVLLILEDHGIPSETFIADLREVLNAPNGPEVVTFYVRNGTTDNAPSRAAFTYLGGFSDVAIWPTLPEPIASAAALRGDLLASLRTRAQAGELKAGEIEYGPIPLFANAGMEELPPSLVLTHYQANTWGEAVSATYWNARFAGEAERGTRPPRGRLWQSADRYVGRAVRLIGSRRYGLPVSLNLLMQGSAGFAGWWMGQFYGRGGSAAGLRDVHPVPASAT